MSRKNDIAIKVDNVSKHFLLPHQKASTLKSFFLNPFTKFENEKQLALDNVSFEIKKGEFFGIIGRNGSGKSTLLKCMAGVYTPDKGHISGNGSIVPFIELGVGFNPELSGRDNVYLNGSLLGFSRQEITKMYGEIVEFAELGEFMDQKLKNYSSGMQVRLAFSIAIRARGDILLLDEVLAVGDTNFKEKCFNYFEKVKNGDKTIILVSHDMDSVERYCDRVALIDKGKLLKVDKAYKVIQAYNELNIKPQPTKLANKNIKSAQIVVNIDERSGGASFSPDDQNINLEFAISSNMKIEDAVLGIIIRNSRGLPIFATNTDVADIGDFVISPKKPKKIKLEIENIFSNGKYSISTTLRSKDKINTYQAGNDVRKFLVEGRNHSYALVSPKYDLSVVNKD